MTPSFEISLTGPETNTMTYFSLFENKAVKDDCPLHFSTKKRHFRAKTWTVIQILLELLSFRKNTEFEHSARQCGKVVSAKG